MANYFGTSKKVVKLGTPVKTMIVVITGAVIFGGVYGYKVINGRTTSKPTPKTNNTSTPTPTTNTPATETPPKTNYDGTYKGATSVVNGLASVVLTVAGATTSGTATYNGTVNGIKVSAPVTLTGTVNDKGAVSVNISGSTVVFGQNIKIGGTGSGQITGNNMNGTYKVSGIGFSDSGAITLTK